MAEEIKLTEGRRIKVYKLKAEAVDDAELQSKVTEQLQKFGAVDSSMIRHSKDGCSWMVAVYATAEAAAAACDDDAIADALTAEELADPEQGFCVCELCTVEKDMAYLAKKESGNKPARTSFVTYMQAANGDAADVDAMLAGLLRSEKTTQGLLEQVVNPTVKGVKKELVTAGRKVVKAVTKVLQDEVQSLREDLGAMKELLETAVGTKAGVLKRRKVASGEKRARTRTRSRTRTPVAKASGVPASALNSKAVRKKKSVDGASAEEAEKGASMRMLQALMANKNGPAIVAQMVSAEDQATLSNMFDNAAQSGTVDDDEDDEEDEDMSEDDDMYDDEEDEEDSDGV
jgi:hypothetical protein